MYVLGQVSIGVCGIYLVLVKTSRLQELRVGSFHMESARLINSGSPVPFSVSMIFGNSWLKTINIVPCIFTLLACDFYVDTTNTWFGIHGVYIKFSITTEWALEEEEKFNTRSRVD